MVTPNPLRVLIYSTHILPKHCWNHHTAEEFALHQCLLPSIPTKITSSKEHNSLLLGERRNIFSPTGSELLQSRAIPVKPGEMSDLTPPPLLLRHLDSPTLSTALLLITSTPAGAFVVFFCLDCSFFVWIWFGFANTAFLFKSLHPDA